jgi:hypothetical protein
MLVPVLATLGIVLGTIGGLFGRVFHLVKAVQSHG